MKKNLYQKYIEELDTMSDEQLLELESTLDKKENVYQEFIDSVDELNEEQLKALKETIIKSRQQDKDNHYQLVSKTH